MLRVSWSTLGFCSKPFLAAGVFPRPSNGQFLARTNQREGLLSDDSISNLTTLVLQPRRCVEVESNFQISNPMYIASKKLSSPGFGSKAFVAVRAELADWRRAWRSPNLEADKMSLLVGLDFDRDNSTRSRMVLLAWILSGVTTTGGSLMAGEWLPKAPIEFFQWAWTWIWTQVFGPTSGLRPREMAFDLHLTSFGHGLCLLSHTGSTYKVYEEADISALVGGIPPYPTSKVLCPNTPPRPDLKRKTKIQ